MDSNQYYQDLIQQGYSSADAANFTQQYYPDFQGTAQGMSMMTPPPPGSMEMGAGLAGQGVGGIAAGGMGTGGMAAGGITAGATGAAATGGMSVATIVIVSVLVLGGAGTGGYFLYDYLTEPDFYGESKTFQFDDRDAANDPPMSANGSDALVHVSMTQGYSIDWSLIEIRIVVDGSVSNLCVAGDSYENIYYGDQCTYSFIDDNYWDVAEEITISEGENADLCDGSNDCVVDVMIIKKPMAGNDGQVFLSSSTRNPDNFVQFDWRDALNDPEMSEDGGDALIHIQMMKGQSINWALVEVSIGYGTDDGVQKCVDIRNPDEDGQMCTYSFLDEEGNEWDLGEEITISEGANQELCDGVADICEVVITIGEKAVGDSDGREITIWTNAEP